VSAGFLIFYGGSREEKTDGSKSQREKLVFSISKGETALLLLILLFLRIFIFQEFKIFFDFESHHTQNLS
jgi:hypothetical protein